MTLSRLYPSAPPLSRLCLGAATFGREIDQVAAFMLMDHARAKGITLIDTATNYSAGASETIVGAWLAARRPDPSALMVATKIYPPYTPDAIDAAVTASAGRIGVKTIDVLYLHKWDATAETPEAMKTLHQLVESGRVRALGVSNFNAAQLKTVLALQADAGSTRFRLLQNNNNLAIRDVDVPLRALCVAHDIAIVTYSPLGAGFLTGKHRQGIEPGSRFAVSPGHRDVYLHPLAEQRLARLADISARTRYSMTELALAWAIHHPGVSSVLVGGRGPQHIDQALSAAALNLPEIFAELERD
ncbi:MAG: aldo/keto reductase [Opitutus sp.]